MKTARLLSGKKYRLYATPGTGAFLRENGIPAETLGQEEILGNIKDGSIDMVVNTPTRGKNPDRFGFQLRRTAIEFNTTCFTSLDTTEAVMDVLDLFMDGKTLEVYSLDHYSGRYL
ncbi:MAG: hypothetical protein R6W96_00240 [Clostridia bacterium]